ncbi:MAG: hypothetical protein VYB65_14380, partial [Myxococcota bacterium]|nr:hypothetical protein [Myxococcota bacterium]
MESCILYEDLSFLVEFYMNADFPEELWPWIASASLFAIDKTGEGKPEGARPIGAGTVYRRLAWRCALAIDAERIASLFLPHQFACCVPGGVEFCHHIVRIAGELFDGEQIPHVKISADASNFFNEVDRAAILEEVSLHLGTWLSACEMELGPESHLVVRLSDGSAELLVSSCGLQQGAVPAMVLSALPLRKIVLNIAAQFPCVKIAGYADDQNLVGPVQPSALAFEMLRREGARVGYFVNVKTRVSASRVSAEELPQCLQALTPGGRGAPICAAPELAGDDSDAPTIDEWLFPSNAGAVSGQERADRADDAADHWLGGLKRVLGAAVGGPQLELGGARQVVLAAAHIAEQLPRLRDSQLQFVIWRWSVKARFPHLLRMLQPDVVRPAARAHDLLGRRTVAAILGRVPGDLTGPHGLIAALPPKHGGADAGCHAAIAPAAYVACMRGLARMVAGWDRDAEVPFGFQLSDQTRVGLLDYLQLRLVGPGGGQAPGAMAVDIAEPALVLPQRSTPHALARAVSAVAEAGPSTSDLELLNSTSALFRPDRFELAISQGNDASQRNLSSFVYLGLRARLLEQAPPTLRAIARSNASPGAYEWLSATGSRATCRLASPVFSTALNMRLGLAPPRLIPEDGSGGGCDCNSCFSELRGFALACHFAGCAKQGLCNFAHDNVVATIFDEARRIGERPSKEVSGMFAVSNARPDLSFPSLGVDTRGNDPDQAQHARRGPPPPRLAGLRLVADVKTVNPICDSHLSESSRSALSAAIAGEIGKVHKYGHLVNQQGAEFIGLGFETTGAMSPGALLLVKRLSTRADERG